MIKFNTLFFLIGFAIGILYVYVSNPEKNIIVKHPTPQNAGKIVYKDKVNNCYKYIFCIDLKLGTIKPITNISNFAHMTIN